MKWASCIWNGSHMLGNGTHVLENGPHVLDNEFIDWTQFMDMVFLSRGGKATAHYLS